MRWAILLLAEHFLKGPATLLVPVYSSEARTALASIKRAGRALLQAGLYLGNI